MKRLLTAVLATMAGGCTYLPFLQVAPADYRYVLVGPEGIPVARAITADAACPALELDGVARPMTAERRATCAPIAQPWTTRR